MTTTTTTTTTRSPAQTRAAKALAALRDIPLDPDFANLLTWYQALEREPDPSKLGRAVKLLAEAVDRWDVASSDIALAKRVETTFDSPFNAADRECERRSGMMAAAFVSYRLALELAARSPREEMHEHQRDTFDLNEMDGRDFRHELSVIDNLVAGLPVIPVPATRRRASFAYF